MMAFLSIIGFSGIKARFIQQILTISSCLLVALGVKIWTENHKMFWITLFTGLTLPWGFLQANRMWDPSFTPVYFSLHFFFFVLLMKNSKKITFKTNLYAIISFVALVLLATVYPTARIPAVAMWICCMIWAIKEKKIKRNTIISIFVLSSIAALPLALQFLDPEFNRRAARLVIFSEDMPFYQMIHELVKGFAELINPSFLFVTGDPIYRHSLPIFGMLGTISIVPFICILRTRKPSPLVTYSFFVVMMTYLSTALCYEYQPHALRSCLAWPPYTILLSYGWFDFFKSKSKKVCMIWYFVIAVQFVLYFILFMEIHNGNIKFYV